jgi:anthraniloyl-CoA monooxygenase
MPTRRISVIGGGPGGLFTARLLALGHPDWDVCVYERLPPDDTFGFGVGLTGGLVRALGEADPEVQKLASEAAFSFSGAEFRLPQGTATLPQFHAGALGRARLPRLLTAEARAAGVTIELRESPSLETLSAESDLVIAADGVSSGVRQQYAQRLGAEETVGRGLFIWCGSRAPMSGTAFVPVRTEHGLFVAHAYPYASDQSTYVVETDHATLERAGCWTSEFESESDSDRQALDYLSEAFSDLLDGRPFIGNKSRWMSFRTVRCERWHFDNVVLLGDAKATAHPSIGSGTKLAMEDGIALARALEDLDGDDPADRLPRFESGRRPEVERLQERAEDSQLWWESFGDRLAATPTRLAVGYLSRAGAVSLEELLVSGPSLARTASAEFAEVPPEELPDSDLCDWVLSRPLSRFGVDLPDRFLDPGSNDLAGLPVAELDVRISDPWGEEADELLKAAHRLVLTGARILRIVGPLSRADLIDRLALGEHLRGELDALIAVEGGEEDRVSLADGLVAGRTDLVSLARSGASDVE